MPAPIRNYALLALALALAPQAGRTAQPAASIFNEGFLGIGGDQPNADLSVFKFGNQVLPAHTWSTWCATAMRWASPSCASRKRRASATRNPA